jgi:thioredoxin 1
MLYTNLKHIESAEEFVRIINGNENVTIICGRMGPLCITVYRIAEELEEEYDHVKFYDMEYDNPESYFFHALPEVQGFMEFPFTVYYKNGEVVKATGGIQTKSQVRAILDKEFARLPHPQPFPKKGKGVSALGTLEM